MRRILSCLALGAAVAGVSPAFAQEAAPAPAHIGVVDGVVTLNRDGRPDQAGVNMPLVPGDRLRTTSGRLEILFPDGAALDVDEFSEIALASETGIRLTEGRALFRVPRARYDPLAYELSTPAASMDAVASGDYRLSYPDPFESARADDFSQWVAQQATPAPSASAQYLPADLQMYGSTLDESGGWQYDPAYGYVWYPTVAPAWRPYYDGYWAPIRPYGWTWIGSAAWSWPTHHYGRWGYRHDRWFWIPARSWAPAWVAWGAAPDYVTWCPLGWDSRPVFALAASYGDPWVGWTVLPRGSFGYGRVLVAHHTVHPHQLRLAGAAFALQARAPIAVPRAAAAAAASAPRAERPVGVPTYRADTTVPAPPADHRQPAVQKSQEKAHARQKTPPHKGG